MIANVLGAMNKLPFSVASRKFNILDSFCLFRRVELAFVPYFNVPKFSMKSRGLDKGVNNLMMRAS